MMRKILFLAFTILLFQKSDQQLLKNLIKSVRQITQYPRAQCKITWKIPTDCNTARTKIQTQMNAWKETDEKADACPGTSESCPKLPCGQRCRYVFEEIDENGSITGYHLTPAKSYRDNVSFEFSDNGSSCNVVGFSKSTVSYAFLDFGTNYCNLRNLLDGAGLAVGNGFQESTSTQICTQYDQLNCNRY